MPGVGEARPSGQGAAPRGPGRAGPGVFEGRAAAPPAPAPPRQEPPEQVIRSEVSSGEQARRAWLCGNCLGSDCPWGCSVGHRAAPAESGACRCSGGAVHAPPSASLSRPDGRAGRGEPLPHRRVDPSDPASLVLGARIFGMSVVSRAPPWWSNMLSPSRSCSEGHE